MSDTMGSSCPDRASATRTRRCADRLRVPGPLRISDRRLYVEAGIVSQEPRPEPDAGRRSEMPRDCREQAAVAEITYRTLRRDEIERVEEIDRAEVINHVFHLRDGQLALEEEHVDVGGWRSGALSQSKQRIYECLDREGSAWGAFYGDGLVGIAVLDGKRIGRTRDMVDLYFLHVSSGFRDRGIGRGLVGLVKARAVEMGARRLYVSATPSHHTVRFYMGVGFAVTSQVEPELFEREPEDIHMDMELVPGAEER